MAVRDDNFNLQKSTQLRDIALEKWRTNKLYNQGGHIYKIQRAGLNAQLASGLRDINQNQKDALQGVVQNALQRGIFNSGIKQENVAEVNREAGEARGDLRGNITRALDELYQNRVTDLRNRDTDLAKLANQENYWTKLQLQPLAGGSGSDPFSSFINAMQSFIENLLSGMFPNPDMVAPALPNVTPGADDQRYGSIRT